MKKKIVAAAMTAMLAMGMMMPVSAASDSSDTSADATTSTGQMKVTYGVDTSYTLSIDKQVTLKKGEEVYAKVGVQNVNLAPEKQIKLTTNAFTQGSELELSRENDAETKISVPVKLESESDWADIGTSLGTFTEDKTVRLRFDPIPNDVNAGTYKATITIIAEIVDTSA